MATYVVPFYKQVFTECVVEADSLEDAIESAWFLCPGSVEHCTLEDEGDWELDHENIEEQK